MTTPISEVPTLPVLFGVEHLSKVESATTIAFDSETTGLQPVVGGLRLLQIGASGCAVVVIDCWELDEQGWQAVRDFLLRHVLTLHTMPCLIWAGYRSMAYIQTAQLTVLCLLLSC